MTVILALKSAEGLVLATDSQATAMLPGGAPVKLDAVKIVQHENHLLWAGTGAQGCSQRVNLMLMENAEAVKPELATTRMGKKIHECANVVQQQSAAAAVNIGAQAQVESWGGIFCGRASDGLFIAEIDPGGGWQFHPEYAATGSGYAFALLAAGSVKHHDVAAKSLDHAKVLAWRAIEMTCSASAFGVGLPVQMGVVTDTQVSILSSGEIKAVEETVNLWKKAEVDALGVALGGSGGEEAEAEDAEDPGLDAPEG
jgi:20S proteasome alpha/beta subunit